MDFNQRQHKVFHGSSSMIKQTLLNYCRRSSMIMRFLCIYSAGGRENHATSTVFQHSEEFHPHLVITKRSEIIVPLQTSQNNCSAIFASEEDRQKGDSPPLLRGPTPEQILRNNYFGTFGAERIFRTRGVFWIFARLFSGTLPENKREKSKKRHTSKSTKSRRLQSARVR